MAEKNQAIESARQKRERLLKWSALPVCMIFVVLQMTVPKQQATKQQTDPVQAAREATGTAPSVPPPPQVTISKEKPWALMVLTAVGKPGQSDFRFSRETIAAYSTKATCKDMADSPWMDGVRDKANAAARRGGLRASAWDGKLNGDYKLLCLKLKPDGKSAARNQL